MHSYFEGIYFKQQTARESLALIPAKHIDEKGNKSATIQIITNRSSYCAIYPYDEFEINQKKLYLKVGNCKFSSHGIEVNICTDDITASGELRFGQLSPLRYDIMGPFRYVPFMECRHSVFSMSHTVSGCVTINGITLDFNQAAGYIEGDRGRSFPEKYAWTHCSFDRGSIMLSVAEIPYMGMKFTGIIGVVLLDHHEYRIATYLGAKVISIGNGKISVQQGEYFLSAELVQKYEAPLRAPNHGKMSRIIRESLLCTAHYSFEKDGEALLDFSSDLASFEYEYDQ